MILFNNVTTIPGVVIEDSLAYVNDVVISNDRVTMRTSVSLSLLANAPDNYSAYTSVWNFDGIPYDSNSESSPSAQCYAWLMTKPEFEGGTQYPV